MTTPIKAAVLAERERCIGELSKHAASFERQAADLRNGDRDRRFYCALAMRLKDIAAAIRSSPDPGKGG